MLTPNLFVIYNLHKTALYAGVAQSVERILGKDKATGSIPVTSSMHIARIFKMF
jgi:hypothetical protein